MAEKTLKAEMQAFWNKVSCGEVYAQGDSEKLYYESHRKIRYELEPYLARFARFAAAHDKDVLEIGVGMGADHVQLASFKPRSLTGVDLSSRAITHTKNRLQAYGLRSDISVADAEDLPFQDDSFDLVYSWGALHHSPATDQAVDEVYRVLRPNGAARIMIYHKYSLTGYMLWMRYALLRAQPFRPLNDIYCQHLESPGTKAYTIEEAKKIFARFSRVTVKVQLSFADLLEGAVGQKHESILLRTAKKLWPRPLFKALFKHHGLLLLIEAEK